VIEIHGLTKRFGTRKGETLALDRVDLTVGDGEFLCLVGPSGCGKSTMLNVVAGLERADAGRVLVGGKPIGGPGPDRSVMFQEAALFPWLTVAKNVEFGLELAGRPKVEWPERVERYLRLVHLWRFRDSFVHELSGGMRQRVALARALAPDPEVLLMDEPFAALDAQTRDVLHNEVQELWRQSKRTVVFVTHNVREAVRLGDRVIVLAARPGRVMLEVKIDIARPRSVEVEVAHYVRRIMKVLKSEVDKVMQEEIDDGSEPAKGRIPSGPSGGMGSGI
jgi:NitT/TauT family transport system ATP-binding protein